MRARTQLPPALPRLTRLCAPSSLRCCFPPAPAWAEAEAEARAGRPCSCPGSAPDDPAAVQGGGRVGKRWRRGLEACWPRPAARDAPAPGSLSPTRSPPAPLPRTRRPHCLGAAAPSPRLPSPCRGPPAVKPGRPRLPPARPSASVASRALSDPRCTLSASASCWMSASLPLVTGRDLAARPLPCLPGCTAVSLPLPGRPTSRLSYSVKVAYFASHTAPAPKTKAKLSCRPAPSGSVIGGFCLLTGTLPRGSQLDAKQPKPDKTVSAGGGRGKGEVAPLALG